MREHDPAGAGTAADVTAPMILDFLEWLAPAPRPYEEVMEAWRTSCPRLTLWESAVDGGYVMRRRTPGQAAVVEVTDRGRVLLRDGGRPRAA